MSSFALRSLALCCMLVDHAGLALFPNIGAFRCVGRLAFPLYCFLLVQGFLHTRDLRAYARRLLLVAILSEIPFDLLIFGRIACLVEQNVMFSLLLGLLTLCAVRTFSQKPLYGAVSVLVLSMASMLFRVSFGWLSIALCLCFYGFRDQKRVMALSAAGVLMLYTISLHFSGVARSWVLVSCCSLGSIPFLLMYNQKRGLHLPALSLLFYAAYPLHLIALVALRTLRIIPPYFL